MTQTRPVIRDDVEESIGGGEDVAPPGLGMALGQALPARAELVFFESGRSMSVKSYRADGDMLVLSLRGGGEVTCERRMIVRIEPDEVEYRDPVAAKEKTPSAFAPAVPVEYEEMIDSRAAAHGVDARVVKAVIQAHHGRVEAAPNPGGGSIFSVYLPLLSVA